MEITGILKVKFDTQVVSDKFKKREFVVTTGASTQYPQHIAMQLTQEKCQSLDHINIGDEVKAQINIRGREWNGPQGVKYFNTIEAWKLEKWNIAPVQTKQEPVVDANAGEDLPF